MIILKQILAHPFAFALFCWYACLRWILLPVANADSMLWGNNSIGNFGAIASAIFLAYYIVKDIPKGIYSSTWLIATVFLGFYNIWCLWDMTGIFVRDVSLINTAFMALDLYILAFYIGMIIRVCHTIDNKNCENRNCKIKTVGV